MKVGDKVKVVRSDHPAINPGEIGEIACVKGSGFGIRFTKVFPATISNIKPQEETRTIYFEGVDLE